MTDEIRAREGDWVEVEVKLLDPADRSKNLRRRRRRNR